MFINLICGYRLISVLCVFVRVRTWWKLAAVIVRTGGAACIVSAGDVRKFSAAVAEKEWWQVTALVEL